MSPLDYTLIDHLQLHSLGALAAVILGAAAAWVIADYYSNRGW